MGCSPPLLQPFSYHEERKTRRLLESWRHRGRLTRPTSDSGSCDDKVVDVNRSLLGVSDGSPTTWVTKLWEGQSQYPNGFHLLWRESWRGPSQTVVLWGRARVQSTVRTRVTGDSFINHHYLQWSSRLGDSCSTSSLSPFLCLLYAAGRERVVWVQLSMMVCFLFPAKKSTPPPLVAYPRR